MNRPCFADDSAPGFTAVLVLTATLTIAATVASAAAETKSADPKAAAAKPAAAETKSADPKAAAAKPAAAETKSADPKAAAAPKPAADSKAAAAPAAQPDPPRDAAAEAAWKAYEKRWSETSSYVAGFRQTIEVADIGTKVESAGRFYFAKPDKVQWQYTEGPPQSVVGDGQWLWLYQPDLEQVYKIPYGQAFGRGGLVALLAGREGVSERYRATLDSSGDGTVRIRLTPLDKADGDLEVTLAADTFDLRAVVVHDPAGSVTNMVFSDPVRNRGLDASLFTFTPPAGVDIITDHEAGF